VSRMVWDDKTKLNFRACVYACVCVCIFFITLQIFTTSRRKDIFGSSFCLMATKSNGSAFAEGLADLMPNII
jgi:hypothetical protein